VIYKLYCQFPRRIFSPPGKLFEKSLLPEQPRLRFRAYRQEAQRNLLTFQKIQKETP
jgi:hypothetical protein